MDKAYRPTSRGAQWLVGNDPESSGWYRGFLWHPKPSNSFETSGVVEVQGWVGFLGLDALFGRAVFKPPVCCMSTIGLLAVQLTEQ